MPPETCPSCGGVSYHDMDGSIWSVAANLVAAVGWLPLIFLIGPFTMILVPLLVVVLLVTHVWVLNRRPLRLKTQGEAPK